MTGSVTQTTANQDICVARVTVITKTAQGAIVNNTNNTYNLSISFADGSITDISDFSTISLNVNGTNSKNNANIPSTITYTEFSA